MSTVRGTPYTGPERRRRRRVCEGGIGVDDGPTEAQKHSLGTRLHVAQDGQALENTYHDLRALSGLAAHLQKELEKLGVNDAAEFAAQCAVAIVEKRGMLAKQLGF